MKDIDKHFKENYCKKTNKIKENGVSTNHYCSKIINLRLTIYQPRKRKERYYWKSKACIVPFLNTISGSQHQCHNRKK